LDCSSISKTTRTPSNIIIGMREEQQLRLIEGIRFVDKNYKYKSVSTIGVPLVNFTLSSHEMLQFGT
jgi:hypothetical protein